MSDDYLDYWSSDFPDDFPDSETFEETNESYRRRIVGLKNKLTDFGAFEFFDIVHVLNECENRPAKSSKTFVATEKVAKWLRSELHRIRKEQRITGNAPVLTSRTMSPADIADIAISMLEDINQAPGPELIKLLMELLKQITRRRSLANQPNKKKLKAVRLEAINPNVGVNELARKVGVTKSSVSRWRSDPSYENMVRSETKELKSFISLWPPDTPEWLRRAFYNPPD